ncbi:MAG TPA: FGGY-family carbohydrate kinase, partial [Phycisphaerae bacterium]|nr:FGGY-family carbohydrate kinase [Phycisphaerae bacterium]
RKAAEFTIATTTQAYDPRKGCWADELIGQMDLPRKIFPEIIPTGSVLGPVRKDIAEETGAGDVKVIAPAEHDTGAAVAAVPAVGGRSWAFLSSGTWSLMGMETDKPIINAKSLAYNFTNEGCFGGTFRFLKNIMGLWLVQECRRTWERAGKSYSYAELTDLAAKAKPFLVLLNPDDPSFLAPGDMPARIAEFCKKTGQQVPGSPGEFVRVCLESLAMSYRRVIARMEECAGRKLELIHAVGGGIQNRQLCQWAADATGRPVIAGPVEATATGNIAIQAIATGVLADLKAARQLVRQSFELVTYEPKDTARWEEPYRKFEQITA